MNIKILLILASALLITPNLFFKIPLAEASTKVNLFQITSDSTQQKDPIVYKNIVAYDSLSDIWGYKLDTKTNFSILEKPGQQYLTGFFKNLIIYDDFNETTSHDSVRLYNMATKEDTLIAGEPGSRSGGVTNGRYVMYIEGGACGQIHAYNLKKKTDAVISPTGCGPLRVFDDTVIWLNGAPGGTNIYGYDLERKRSMDIVTDPGFQESANIFEDNVVYLEYITGSLGDYNAIKMKNIRTGKKKTIYESTTSTLQWPAISDKYVVWSESTAQHVNGVKGANLNTGEVFEVQPQGPHQNSHTMLSIWGNTASWMSFRTGNGDIYGAVLKK